MYIGIDYGGGKTNIDPATGIRFGVINQHKVISEAVNDIVTQGRDLRYEAALDEAIEGISEILAEHVLVIDETREIRCLGLRIGVKEVRLVEDKETAERASRETIDRLAGQICGKYSIPKWMMIQALEEMVSETLAEKKFGDLIEELASEALRFCDTPGHYLYEQDGYKISFDAEDGDMFVEKSPFYTEAAYCSPCAPGAVYLADPREGGAKGYCLGHDWFEEGKAPYPVFSVDSSERIDDEA